MKILVTESQYNRVISESDYFSKLTVEEMEEKMKLFFTSADDYKRNLGMFIRLYLHLDSDDIKFTWYPQLNNENFAKFQLKCHFPMDSRQKHGLQFSFTENKKYPGEIIGQFNGFLEVDNGITISHSLYLVNIQSMGNRAAEINMEDIRNYTKEFAKQAKRYIR